MSPSALVNLPPELTLLVGSFLGAPALAALVRTCRYHAAALGPELQRRARTARFWCHDGFDSWRGLRAECSALEHAACRGLSAACGALLALGVGSVTNALLIAADHGHAALAHELVHRHGALWAVAADAADYAGVDWLPVHHAAMRGHSAIVRMLTRFDDDVIAAAPEHRARGAYCRMINRAGDDRGRTPVDCALHARHSATVRVLIELGAEQPPRRPAATSWLCVAVQNARNSKTDYEMVASVADAEINAKLPWGGKQAREQRFQRALENEVGRGLTELVELLIGKYERVLEKERAVWPEGFLHRLMSQAQRYGEPYQAALFVQKMGLAEVEKLMREMLDLKGDLYRLSSS